MFLIVGLGNPGKEYEKNRHNAGYMFVDFFKKNSNIKKDWKFDKYSNSEIAKITFQTPKGELTALLAKPQTFMNRSGEAVRTLLTKDHIEINNLIVVHDDLDIELGKFKIQNGTGPKVHNGISSIESTLKNTQFPRIRIGIDNRNNEFRMPGESYVLQNFNSDELKKLQSVFPDIIARFTENISALI